MADDVETLIARFESAFAGRPDQPLQLIGLAEVVARKKAKLRAAGIARRAIAMAPHDARVVARGRAVLAALISGYHVPMMNDARRNAAWDKALRRAIRPGMHVFEIGTGAGMLAMMAARAGAGHVTTCEDNALVAVLAREIVAHNGFADRITVLDKKSQAVAVGADLPRKADLLFCDIFADNLVSFDPFTAIADARARLLAPGAPSVPRAVSLFVAPTSWDDYARSACLDHACGFDLTPMKDFAPSRRGVAIDNREVHVVSDAAQAFRIDLNGENPALAGSVVVECRVPQACEVNAIVRWIRLELDDETFIEARPEPGAKFFSAPELCILPEPRHLSAGEALRIAVSYDHQRIETFVAD
jgi:Ribosomal protein L11 methyltransferase (PrmA)